MCRSKSSRKYFKRALQRFDRAGRQRAERVARRRRICVIASRIVEVSGLRPGPSSIASRMRSDPRQAVPARRAPAAGFLREEVLEVPGSCRPGRCGRRARSSCPCPCGCRPSAPRVEIHLHVEVLFGQKVRRCAARQEPAELVAVAHAAGVLLQDLAHRRAHRQLPQAGPLHPAAGAVELRAAVLAACSAP